MEIIKIKELKSILLKISARKIFSNESIEIIEINLLPKEIIPSHVNEKTALFNIIDGMGILTVSNKKHYIEKGDFVKIDKGLNREIFNDSDIPLKIIVTKLMN